MTPTAPPAPVSVTFTPSLNGLTFTSNAFTADTISSDGGQITLTTDTSGRARFITLDIPLRGTTPYHHTFDLAGAIQADPSGPLSGFIALREGTRLADGSSPHNLVLDPTLNFSTYGVWLNVQSVDNAGAATGVTGGIAFGNLTPVGSLPTSGQATYSGRTIGAAISGTTQSVLAGTVGLMVDFAHMNIGGTFTISDVTSGTAMPWGTLTLPTTGIVAVNGGVYTYGGINNLTGNIPGGALTVSSLNGHFYGPSGQETAGTWTAASPTTVAFGAYGAARH